MKKDDRKVMLGNVLVLDDDKESAIELAHLLRKSVPCNIDATSTPQSVLSQISHGDCDLLITDLNMPGRDGLAVLAEIKAFAPRCEVIVLTAYSSISSAIESMKLGAVNYIVRDAGTEWFDQLIAATRQALSVRPSGRSPGFHRENLIHFFLERVGFYKGSTNSSYGLLPQGLALEYAVKLLLESCEGFETTLHRVRTRSEELDVVGVNQVKQGFWGRQGSLVLVECKDYGKTRPGANERGRFEEKIRNRQGHSTVGVFVSPSGFAKTFITPSSRTPVPGGPIPIIIMIDGPALKDWAKSYDRLSWLTEKALAAVI